MEQETQEAANPTHEEAALHFLNESHVRVTNFLEANEAMNNPNLYPFELIHTTLLMSIAHGVQALNAKFNTVQEETEA